jgi:hypothetical protein
VSAAEPPAIAAGDEFSPRERLDSAAPPALLSADGDQKASVNPMAAFQAEGGLPLAESPLVTRLFGEQRRASELRPILPQFEEDELWVSRPLAMTLGLRRHDPYSCL